MREISKEDFSETSPQIWLNLIPCASFNQYLSEIRRSFCNVYLQLEDSNGIKMEYLLFGNQQCLLSPGARFRPSAE